MESTCAFTRKFSGYPRLYTNIPLNEGIAACKEALNSRELPVPPTADLCHLIWLILSLNSFTFSKKHYLQIQGTVMGTNMAPSYANLFTGKLEQEFLQTLNKKPRVWWRYIDDTFAIWTHDEPSLCTFVVTLIVTTLPLNTLLLGQLKKPSI